MVSIAKLRTVHLYRWRKMLSYIQLYTDDLRPEWWPMPEWKSNQTDRKADCQKVNAIFAVAFADKPWQ
jgi:hypothetical protein